MMHEIHQIVSSQQSDNRKKNLLHVYLTDEDSDPVSFTLVVKCFADHGEWDIINQKFNGEPNWRVLSEHLQAMISSADSNQEHGHFRDMYEDVSILCPQHQDDLFSLVRIDPTLSRLDREELGFLRFIYLKIAYGQKFHYFEGDAKFALRKLSFSEPLVENIIVGECQSGKSAEAAWVAWNSFYVLGCLPVILVRNSGGKIQGIDDMKRAIEKMNERVREVPVTEMGNPSSTLITNARDREALRLSIENKRFELMVETCVDVACPPDGQLFPRGKALVMLQNPSHIKKMVYPYRTGGTLWFKAVLGNQNAAGEWEVIYVDSIEREYLCERDIRPGRKKTSAISKFESGVQVFCKKSQQLCNKQSLFKRMERYGLKNEKKRISFIIDEADLSVGNPMRNRNQTEKLLYQCSIEKCRGAREHTFAYTFITATPQALITCTWENQQDHESDSDDLQDQEAADDEGDEGEQSEDIEEDPEDASVDLGDKPDSDTRILKPHLVFCDRPTNYIAYQFPESPFQHGKFIMRQYVDPRHRRVTGKYFFYKKYFEQNHFSPEEWADLEKKAVSSGEKQEIFDGFGIQSSKGTLKVVVSNPPKKRTAEQSNIFDIVNAMFLTARDHQKRCTIWDMDGDSISEMLGHVILHERGNYEYRHALIISSQTKRHEKQKQLQDKILEQWPHCKNLCVATFNCSGIRIKFTEKMIDENADLLNQVQRAVMQAQSEEAGRPGGTVLRNASCFIDGDVVILKNLPIGFMYEGLKKIVSRIVVVAGEIGGRGVAYHDLKHERILTDIYTAQDLCKENRVSQHGELMVQVLGRLNTIYCSLSGRAHPQIRLWACKALHELHTHTLNDIFRLCKLVQETKDYKKAYQKMHNYATGFAPGKGFHLVSMMRFKGEHEMRGQKTIPVEMTSFRHKGYRGKDSEEYFPKQSQCKCQLLLPGKAGDIEQHEELAQNYNWTESSGVPWNGEEHYRCQVTIPEELQVQDKILEFLDKNRNVVLRQPSAQTGTWYFKNLESARDFICAGAAGEDEAERFKVRGFESKRRKV